MRTRSVLSLMFGLALTACGQPATNTEPPQEAAPAAAPAAAQTGAAAPAPAQGVQGLPRTAAPAGAEVYFIEPANGARVSNPVRVVFGLRGAGVAPAGVQSPNTGHHHLLVDADMPPVDLPIPADNNHRHFGMGQTETTLELPPGEHRLQLLLGDHLHIPHDPPVTSEAITITVQ
jgi:hypothetical protein